MDNSAGKYVDLPFESTSIEASSLTLANAKLLHNFIQKYQPGQLVELRKAHTPFSYECLILDLKTHGYQYPKEDIDYTERIAIVLDALDETVPRVLALRKDFPRLSHMNSEHFDTPKSICLYDQPYSDIKLTLTPYQFLEKIRIWLNQAATGKLHEDGQILEPFFANYEGYLLIPPNFDISNNYSVSLQKFSKESYYFRLVPRDSTNLHPFKLVTLVAQPTIHSAINVTPRKFADLDKLLKSIGLDPNKAIKEVVQSVDVDLTQKLLIFVTIPTIRQQGGEVESKAVLAFLTFKTIEEIGLENDLLAKDPDTGLPGPLLFKPSEDIIDFDIGSLIPVNSLTQELAARYNGIPPKKDLEHILIGVGAIGSQIFNNLSKMGYGNWDLIDNDVVLPHNLAKHALGAGVFEYKSEELSKIANHLLGDASFSKGHTYNALKFDLSSFIQKTNTRIIDTSASVAVARRLAALDVENRCMSIFISPSGTDLVIIQEDSSRDNRLDDLEMQYLRAIINEDSLKEHFDSTGNIRYAASCRAVTNRIPQDFIALHSAIASNFIRSDVSDSASISIWSVDQNDLSTTKHTIQTSSVNRHNLNGWTIVIDELLQLKLYEVRTLKLPNETGGILFGSYDIQRKIVYVVDLMCSPTDSTETPRNYRRGIDGVGERIQEIEGLTIGQITYIGEWHSHPDSASLKMSSADKIHYQWVKSYFEKVSLPPLTIIVGDQEYKIYCNLGDVM